MRGFNFTERGLKVFMLAGEEAKRLNHEYIGTEHLLLALIREGQGTGAAILRNLNVDLDAIRLSIDQTIKVGKAGLRSEEQLPFTSRALKVLELAAASMMDLGHDNIGTEHLLLGLIREERGIAAQVLTDAGLTVDLLTAETLRHFGVPPDKAKSMVGRKRIVSVKIEVQLNDGSIEKVEFNSVPATISYLNRI